MKTSLTVLKVLKRSLTVELPIDTFKQKTDKILQKITQQTHIDGFRKGKAPLSMLRQRFGASASSDAVNEIVNETLIDALAAEKVTPVAQPVITEVDSKSQQDFSYTVEFEVFPEIKINDFSKLTIPQTQVEITKQDEEKALQDLLEQSTEYKPVKRPSKIKDRLSIDFKGTIDGKVFAGGEATDFQIVLGKGSMIKGFEDGLIDKTSATTTTLNLQFPKDYQATEVAGKNVIFTVSIKEVAVPKAAKLDAEFAKKFGEKSVEDLQKNIKQKMHFEVNKRLSKQNKEAVFNALLAANEFEVPQSSIDNEAQNLLAEMQTHLQQQGLPDKRNLPASTFNTEAARRVRLGLLIGQISRTHKLQASKQQIDGKLVEISQIYGEDSQKMITYYRQDPKRLSTIELLVAEEMVEAKILASAKVNKQNKDFQEAINDQDK